MSAHYAFKTEKEFKNFQTQHIPKDRETVFIEELEKNYVFNKKENNWEEFDEIKGNININQYDLVKSGVAQLPDYNMAQIESAKSKIAKLKNNINTQYFMLLNKDLNYYTIFILDNNNEENFEEVVIECIQNLGTIKSITFADEAQQALEIWVQSENGECSIGYLFDYKEGIIQCK